MLRRRKTTLHSKSNTSNNNIKINSVWDEDSVRKYFNYKSESEDDNDNDNDDYIDKIVDEQIEKLLSKPKIIKSNIYVKIFTIIFLIFLILLILFLSSILFLYSNYINHLLYIYLIKLL